MDFQITKYQNLIATLILNGHFINNIGLMHGKMGIAIQFYHLARKTRNPAFETFAEELVTDVIPVLSAKLPFDFENGLAGIGWGIEHLIQNNFLEADGADVVLEEFDKQIFQNFLENAPSNIGLLNGLAGTAHYFLLRVRRAELQQKRVIAETNRLALQHICNHLGLMLPQIARYLEEPCGQNATMPTETAKRDLTPVPIFEITWNLPMLIGFLAEISELNTLQFSPAGILARILTSLDAVTSLPVLQCNKYLLLLSLLKLKNKIQRTSGSGINEISPLTDRIIEKIVTGIDIEKYINEINGLNFSVRNGISGIALVHNNLYEQTSAPKYKNECVSLLNKFLSDNVIGQFRYDYSNPEKINEQKLGILHGISGLLWASACILK